MNKLTALIEAAKAATSGKWKQGMTSHHTVAKRPDGDDYRIAEFHHAADANFVDYANPTTILELCDLLEKAEEALDGCLARLYGELYPNHPETLEVEEAITAIKQWKEQT